jgi:glycosyltransferase involved in cell wall biosynthesis
MKVYSYLATGRAVIATAIRSHTQVLDPAFARLVTLEPEAMAAALRELCADPTLRETLGRRALARAGERHSLGAFRARLAAVYRELEAA